MRPSITELDWKPRSAGWSPHNFHERRKQRQKAYKRASKAISSPSVVKVDDKQGLIRPKPCSYVATFVRNAREKDHQAELRRMEQEREAEIKALELHLAKLRDEQELISDASVKRTLIKDIKNEIIIKYSPYGVSRNDLTTIRRDWVSCLARYEGFYRSRNETGKSYPYIGKHFGGRDHTTVLSGIRRYEQYQRGELPEKLKPFEHLILPADYLEEEGVES